MFVCLFVYRWKRHLDPNINRDRWTQEEDILLCALYFRYDNQWSSIARALDGRTPQQCRTRWHNLSQSHFLATYRAEIAAVNIEAVEKAQEAVNKQKESVTGLPTATTRARMPGKKKKKAGGSHHAGRNVPAANGSLSGVGAIRYSASGNTNGPTGMPRFRMEALGVPGASTQHLPDTQTPLYLGGLGTLQYPPNMLRPIGHHQSMLPDTPMTGYPHSQLPGYGIPRVSEDRPAKKKRGRPSKAEQAAAAEAEERYDSSILLDAVAGFGGTTLAYDGGKSVSDHSCGQQQMGQFCWYPRPKEVEDAFVRSIRSVDEVLVGLNANRESKRLRSAGRRKRGAYDRVKLILDLVGKTWHGQEAVQDKRDRYGGSHHYEGSVSRPGFGGVPGGGLVAMPGYEVVEDGAMLPINSQHHHMTPLKLKQEPAEKNGENGDKCVAGIDNGLFLGLEYLTDEKIPGSKTPLSALKHAPQTAASPLLADLLHSPLINKDQMRGMTMQALLASPAGAGNKRVWNPQATPDSNRLMSDVVRCLDMSDATTAAMGCGGAGGKTTTANNANTGDIGNVAKSSAGLAAGFQPFSVMSHVISDISTPGSIGIQPPLVLDSASRINPGSVMMKNTGSAEETERLYSTRCDTLGIKRQQFVQMPVFNTVDTVDTVALGTSQPVPQAVGGLGPQALPGANFDEYTTIGNYKGINKRRLSIDSVRMSLHALLDKA
jgi:hypothetical protein